MGKTEKKVADVITTDEQKILKNIREKTEARDKCAKEINVILKKYNCSITVDPNSPVREPGIVVTNNGY